MKAIKRLLIVLVAVVLTLKSKAQTAEAEQLLLNWEKLTQLKAILRNMYEGYKTLEKGYNAVRDRSREGFTLHKTFMDGLLEVSPAVKNYRRVADIVTYQLRIVKEYKATFDRFKETGTFTTQEIKYLAAVYARLLRRSLEHLDELTLVLTAGQLRMSDDERLQAIDRIYSGMVEQYTFLHHFNSRAALLSTQRLREKVAIALFRKLYGY